jgi:hypothetical protein
MICTQNFLNNYEFRINRPSGNSNYLYVVDEVLGILVYRSAWNTVDNVPHVMPVSILDFLKHFAGESYNLLLLLLILTAIGLTPGGSSPVHIYKQTVHRIQRKEST